MKTITSTAALALLAATIGLSAVAPAFAQEAAPATESRSLHFRHGDQGPGPRGGIGGRDLLNFARGAEGIEIALVRLSHTIEMTAEQQALFETLKSDALAAAETFAAATEGLRPTPAVEGETPAVRTLSERLENGIALQKARLAALESVQPAATAFFDSLTDEQNVALVQQRPGRDGMPGFGKGGPVPANR